ncbi:transglycosylase domain-containing protein [Candidatus Symbiobacter mobilis]|uniref:Biosynthetic peptidoglycan transglycosylase n=1 Tax=Candidatus Symbiobacter mobilis CR TaxID=946483 RepID=U5N8M1_9BURK|nr:transglycosylase domain-containing protein [Candidatus Symbiobacter mobilis]AGX87670.1 peptidoglycan transglycosylase [Candidatus Symbiobacter mobilis CR]
MTLRLPRWTCWLGWMAVGLLCWQGFFLARVALLAVVDPASTTFERSEWARLAQGDTPLQWKQQWVPYAAIAPSLKRAVIASEDDGFAHHDGIDWNAVEKAWEKNLQAQARMEKQRQREKPRPVPPHAAPSRASKPGKATKPPKVYGGSTITQQLAKNLLLSGERTLLRKGQEFVLTLMLEAMLDKRRIFEIYLNHVEWGEGVFGAEAAARRYFRKPAAKLGANEAARLAVMLPRPKYFEKLPNSSYVAGRAAVIQRRMASAEIP